jgi:hypothetical protein
VTAVSVVVVLVIAAAVLSRSRRLSFAAGLLCIGLGYYLAASGAVETARGELADALSHALGQIARLIPGIAP